jgi:GNAT superfamily N-acetyltransferase
MSTLVTVRPVAPADFDKWLLLWQGYNLFYGRPSLPAEITQMTWSRLFDAYEPVHALVAERSMAVTDVSDRDVSDQDVSDQEGPDKDNELLGLVHYLFHRSTIHIAPVCYLQDLFTTEAARGQGVGRALIEGVYDRARLAGSPRVYWQTHETNSTAMHLYDKVAERSGFVVYRHQV